MKSILVLVSALALGLTWVPSASAAEEPPATPAAKKDCPLCKLPGRAALFAGKVAVCPADCAKLCCTGTAITFVIEGLECERCSSKVTAALSALEGVKVEAVNHQSGRAVLKYDPARIEAARLTKAIVGCGYKVSAQVASFKLDGLHDEAAAGEVEKALAAIAGVRKIETVCSKNGAAIVVFDPAKTNRAQIAAAINATAVKVAQGG